MNNLRGLAALIIAAVLKGQSLTVALTQQLQSQSATTSASHLEERDRAFVQMLCYGVCRYYPQLEFVLNQLLKNPLAKNEYEVHALLLIGLYQLMHTRVPHHAVVSETVNAIGKQDRKRTWARGLINAILRTYLREQDHITNKINANEIACYAHPPWFIDAVRHAWPNDWQTILQANNAQAPMALRVNALQTTRTEYLAQTQIDAQEIAVTQSGIILNSPMSVHDIPGFNQGMVSVQDGAAQLAAELLKLEPQQTVLDACAAPGGKLTHILEIEPHLKHCVALDSDASRIKSIQENLSRLHLHANVMVADAANTAAYWDGQAFDRILCDAPCSATGVIRRHPDIKLLRKVTDIENDAKQQLRLLNALWPLLKTNGILLYVTCSILPTENTDVVTAFMRTHDDALEDPIQVEWGIPCTVGRQLLPGNSSNLDGFYFARLRKR